MLLEFGTELGEHVLKIFIKLVIVSLDVVIAPVDVLVNVLFHLAQFLSADLTLDNCLQLV